jgi:hypothetical protein
MKHLLTVQILTETRYKELLPGFSKPVMNFKPFQQAFDEDESIFMVMSNLLKPASSLMKLLSETRFTVHKGLPETRQCSNSKVSKLEHRFYKRLPVRPAELVSMFLEAV